MCKYVPPLFVALGSRSSASDGSLHSLHKWVGFHLIRSQTTKLLKRYRLLVASVCGHQTGYLRLLMGLLGKLLNY
jgi:hypothetical protein